MSTTVRKNGKAYDSGDVVITIIGAVESEVKSITYSTEQEGQVNHSLNNDGTSWSLGKIKHEAEIELYMNASKKLEKLAPGGDLLKLAPFDINITFVNEFNDIINDTITVKIMSQGRSVTGEMGLAYAHKLMSLGNQYNNA